MQLSLPLPAATPGAPVLLSLFDRSGVWSRPYALAGWLVIRVDSDYQPGIGLAPDGALNLGAPIGTDGPGSFTPGSPLYRRLLSGRKVAGILAAPPCKAFSKVGARHWKAMDADGRTAHGVALACSTLEIIADLSPEFWALENPAGRLWNRRGTGLLQDRFSAPRFTFDPADFALLADSPTSEAHRKYTQIWGSTSLAIPASAPIPLLPRDHLPKSMRSRTQALAGKDWRTRAQTPQGFARSFFAANSATV